MPAPLPLPPENLRVGIGPFADGALFQRSGETTVRDVIELCGLRSDGAVLDVGCGCGRLAMPLTQFLTPGGQYAGFDVDRTMVQWCQENVASRFPNFAFQHADLRAARYNPEGLVAVPDLVFPYPQGTFDLVIAASVFTHMLPDAIDAYAEQIAHVLKPDGRLFMTALLFDTEAAEAVVTGRTIFNFRHAVGPCLTFDKEHPEEGIAFPEEWFSALLASHGLAIATIRRGNWRTVRGYQISHDYVIAERIRQAS